MFCGTKRWARSDQVVLHRQVLALANIGSSTFTNFLAREGTNIPAFQTFFNYVLLNIVYTSITLYKYGLKKWAKLLWRDGWKCKLDDVFSFL